MSRAYDGRLPAKIKGAPRICEERRGRFSAAGSDPEPTEAPWKAPPPGLNSRDPSGTSSRAAHGGVRPFRPATTQRPNPRPFQVALPSLGRPDP